MAQVTWAPDTRLAAAAPSGVGGVYLIGYRPTTSASIYTLYVGQSVDIGRRLSEHRQDSRFTIYESRGTLYATWASPSVLEWDGIERYLADRLKPIVSSVHPDVRPIEVNVPLGWI